MVEPMAIHIDKETEELAAQIASITGETEADAVRKAVRERSEQLSVRASAQEKRKKQEPGSLLRFLETEIWPLIPEEDRGKPPMTKAEWAEALGYGPEEP